MSKDFKKILIFGYRHLGDTLFITPALSSLKTKFPDSHLTLLAGKASYELLKGNPAVDELIVLPKISFKEKLKIRKILKRERFDTAILFRHTFLDALFIYFLGIPQRVGLAWKGCGPFLTHKVSYCHNWHEVERYLEIVKLLGARSSDKGLKVFISSQDKEFAKVLLQKRGVTDKDLLIGLNPGSSEKWKIKRWGKERFAQLSDELIKRDKAKIIIFAGPDNDGLTSEITELMENEPIVLEERVTLKQLAALIGRCHLFITNDTGPMHIAEAMKTKVIDIVGPSDTKKTGPLGDNAVIIKKDLPCRPCKKRTCEDLSCLKLITVEEVLERAEEQIAQTKKMIGVRC